MVSLSSIVYREVDEKVRIVFSGVWFRGALNRDQCFYRIWIARACNLSPQKLTQRTKYTYRNSKAWSGRFFFCALFRATRDGFMCLGLDQRNWTVRELLRRTCLCLSSVLFYMLCSWNKKAIIQYCKSLSQSTVVHLVCNVCWSVVNNLQAIC